jgi:hypothetical protein
LAKNENESTYSHDPAFENINLIHDAALIQHFVNGTGRKAILLTPSFPFLFIGRIVGVIDDILELDVETTHFSQLEGRIWHIHIHSIETFYIERDDGLKIPELKD